MIHSSKSHRDGKPSWLDTAPSLYSHPPPSLLHTHREEDMKNSLLSQILEQNARARCKTHIQHEPNATHYVPYSVNSIALVKPDKAKSVEVMLIRMAQSGQISGKVKPQPADGVVTGWWCVFCRWGRHSLYRC